MACRIRNTGEANMHLDTEFLEKPVRYTREPLNSDLTLFQRSGV